MEFKEYNSKIVSADKAEREKDLKLDQFYLGFVLVSVEMFQFRPCFIHFSP